MRLDKGKEKLHDALEEKRKPLEPRSQEAVEGGGGGSVYESSYADEEKALEIERQREGEEEERRAARRARSRFQQNFSEDAEFGQLDYSHIASSTRDDERRRLDWEEEDQGGASLFDEARGDQGYSFKGKEMPVEPFNLSEDRQMGHFDASGNFIFTRRGDDDAGGGDDDDGEMELLDKEHRADSLQADAWLRDAETLATTRAVPSRPERPPTLEEEPINLLELKRKVCEILLPEETVRQAIRRLGQTISLARAVTKGGRGRGKKKAATEPDATTKEKAATQLSESLAKLNDLTDAASKLLDDGWVNIYDFTRERILSGLLEKDGATSPKQSLI